MKKRPDGFLAEKEISHKSEIFDYIKECHEYLWYFVRKENPNASGKLSDFLNFEPKI